MTTVASAHAQPLLKSALSKYRILSPKCGLRVSPATLGCMNFGESHANFLGGCTKEDAFKILDTYYGLGGNFLDTAVNYQTGESETWVGEWMKTRGNRENLVIATKFSCLIPKMTGEVKVNATGNSLKNIRLSVETSLRQLQADYIDILYVHWYDWLTPIPELMRGLNQLVEKGKVLYLGISDTPAWVVSEANEYARHNGLAEFVIYQGEWNVMKRDMEDEVIPMALHKGLAIAPWGALGGGRFLSSKDVEARNKSGEGIRTWAGRGKELTETETKMSAALEKVANEVGNDATVTSVALAWASQKYPYVFPILGGRKVEHLLDNIKAFSFALSDEQFKELEAVKPHEWRSPGATFGIGPHQKNFEPSFLVKAGGAFDLVKAPAAIRPRKE